MQFPLYFLNCVTVLLNHQLLFYPHLPCILSYCDTLLYIVSSPIILKQGLKQSQRTLCYLCVKVRRYSNRQKHTQREMNRETDIETGKQGKRICMYVWEYCVSAHVWKPKEGIDCSLTLYLILLKQSISLNPGFLFSG